MTNQKLDFTYEPGDPGEGYVRLDPEAVSKKQIKMDRDGVEGGESFAGELIIDLDENGRIVGIEILGDVLPKFVKEE